MKIARIALALAAFAALAAGTNDGIVSAAEEYGPDGYPKNIPPPGSTPPTVEEWNAVPREVSVHNSTSYHCETKMLREWLRATCSPYDSYTLKAVTAVTHEGQQHFVGMFGTRASVVVQVVEGKTYKARYTWGQSTNPSYNSTRDLTVGWPKGARPTIAFSDR